METLSVSPEQPTLQSPKATIEEVGPGKAAKWLEANEGNRSLDGNYVSRWSRLMKEGEWMLTSDAIGFDWNGRLLNGQHRLSAIVRSGTTQQFVVVRGLNPESFDRHDTGRARSLKQILLMEGFVNTTHLAAAARLLAAFEDGGITNARNGLIPLRGLAFVRYHSPIIEDSVQKGLKAYRECPKGMVRPSTLCYIYHAMRFRDEDVAWDFVCGVASGLGISNQDDPRHRLRERLLSELKGPQRIDRDVEVALATKAVNKYFEGSLVKQLKYSPGAGERYPQPKAGSSYPFGFFE